VPPATCAARDSQPVDLSAEEAFVGLGIPSIWARRRGNGPESCLSRLVSDVTTTGWESASRVA